MVVMSVSFAAPVADDMRRLRLSYLAAPSDIRVIVQPNKIVEQIWQLFRLQMAWILCEFHSFSCSNWITNALIIHSIKFKYILTRNKQIEQKHFFVHPNSLILSLICCHIYCINIFIWQIWLIQHLFACLNIHFDANINCMQTMQIQQ